MNVNCGLTSTDVLSILLCSANYELNYEDLYLALLSEEDRFLLKYQSNVLMMFLVLLFSLPNMQMVST